MITAGLSIVCAAVVWTCALMLRRQNKAMPKIIHAAAFLAVMATHEHDIDKGVLVPIGPVKDVDMMTVLEYIVEHFGALDQPAINTLRGSIPVV